MMVEDIGSTKLSSRTFLWENIKAIRGKPNLSSFWGESSLWN